MVLKTIPTFGHGAVSWCGMFGFLAFFLIFVKVNHKFVVIVVMVERYCHTAIICNSNYWKG